MTHLHFGFKRHMTHWWSVAALAILLGGPPPAFPGHSCAGLGPAYVCVGSPLTPEPVLVHYNLSAVCNISVKDGNFTDCASTCHASEPWPDPAPAPAPIESGRSLAGRS